MTIGLRAKPTRPRAQSIAPVQRRSPSSKQRVLQAIEDRSVPSIQRRPQSRDTVKLPASVQSKRSKSYRKLEQFRPQTCTLESLQRSHPHIYKDHLSHRLYIDGKAYPAQQVGSLAVVWREELQGFQVYSWALRSPVSAVCFETMGCCHDAAVELDQRFDMDSILRLQPFGAMEAVDEIVQRHCLREEVVLEQQVS